MTIGVPACKGLCKLSRVNVDLLHHALFMLKLVDGVLKLLVEHEAVGDHDHRIKYLFVFIIVEGGKPVGQPGDGIALAASGRVLHQVVVPNALDTRICNQFPHRVELVVSGEDHGFLLDLLVTDLLFFNLKVDEPGQDIEKAIALPDLFPQVMGLISAGILGIACAGAIAQIEGQEVRGFPCEPCGHVDLIRVYGKMHEGPLLELEDQVIRVAVVLILVYGTPPCLAGHGVLEFGRGDRNAVQAQNKVERIIVLVAVSEAVGSRSAGWQHRASESPD